MTTTAYLLQSTLSTPAQADLGILLRDTTALRLLRILQGWARSRLVETTRGTVWVVRHHLEGMLGVVGRTVRRALRLLEAILRSRAQPPVVTHRYPAWHLVVTQKSLVRHPAATPRCPSPCDSRPDS